MSIFEQLFNNKKMPLIMSLPANDPELCRAAFESGADAVKVHINLHHNAGGEDFGSFDDNAEIFSQMLKIANGRPMGIVPGADCKLIAKDIDKVKRSEFAFVSFYTKHLPVSALPIAQSLMAAVDSGYTLSEVATYKSLGAAAIEASIIPSSEYGTLLNYRDLACYNQISSHAGLPVIVPTQRFITSDDLKYLHQAGVSGIMIGAIVTGKSAESIAKAVENFAKGIEKL